ncbi:hypothetical protein Daus18300_010869 [Diaporthe australafricana]|uniref:TauD/TfdA-like domain-containing protein n=1 Tax=Diaporthe australafricana TaxID=127596 RepID=A0ABR3W8R1_9PEZI
MPSAVAVNVATPTSPTGKMTPPLLLQPTKLDEQALETAAQILNIISRYRLSHKSTPKSDEGDLKFLAQIYSKVRAGRLINMCLPAFPFKSPNSTTKVLGYLPDKAEEFALAHLNGLCDAIKNVYAPGSELTIISDGLVYNDLLGVPDRNVWAYGEGLRAMSAAKEFNNIKFNRLKDLVHVDVPDELDEITYVSNATNFRLALLNSFSKRDYDVDLKIADHEDTCLTYRGYLKFLETDLQTIYPINEERSKKKYKKGLGYIAKQMLFRGDAFARAVRETFSDHIRLSIHPSTGEAKISVSPLPTDTFYTTPWHSTIAFRLDGTVTSGLRSDFENDPKLELVYENGRPSYFREKSDLLSWAEEKGGVICEPIYPAGIMIRPVLGPETLSIHDVDSAKVRALSEINSPIIMRGFAKTADRDLFVAKSEELGKPLPWKFGLVLEVKDRGADTRGLNNVLSAEWMPFHYDGLFKTEKRTKEDGTEELVSTPPQFQLFTGVTSSPKTTGYTLFSSSTLVFKHLPEDLSLEYLRKLTWGVSTSSFDATKLRGLHLIVDHPTTGQPCLRYHEPWPESKTAFDPTYVTIEDEDGPIENNDALCATIDGLLHDRRIAYWHSWEKGDLVVSDNILMMHTRSDFTAGCDRELWRIHFD